MSTTTLPGLNSFLANLRTKENQARDEARRALMRLEAQNPNLRTFADPPNMKDYIEVGNGTPGVGGMLHTFTAENRAAYEHAVRLSSLSLQAQANTLSRSAAPDMEGARADYDAAVAQAKSEWSDNHVRHGKWKSESEFTKWRVAELLKLNGPRRLL